MSSYQYQIFNITQHTMSNDLNNLMYMRKYGSLEKNSMPPWIEQKPGGHWLLLGAKSVKYPGYGGNLLI